MDCLAKEEGVIFNGIKPSQPFILQNPQRDIHLDLDNMIEYLTPTSPYIPLGDCCFCYDSNSKLCMVKDTY